jgi:pentatricopeptide repeat protein
LFFFIKCGFVLYVLVFFFLIGFFFFFFFIYNRGSSILFDQVEQKYDVVLWSAMASSFVKNGKYKDGIYWFRRNAELKFGGYWCLR